MASSISTAPGVRVERLKGSKSAVHPLAGREVRLLWRLSRLADAPRHYWAN